jgi:hypothetical protein
MGCTTERSEFSPGRVKNFLFSASSRPDLGPTQPPIQWVPGSLSPGIKRQGREADYSPPASAEVMKLWIYTSTPPYAFMAYCLISWAQGQLYLFYRHVMRLPNKMIRTRPTDETTHKSSTNRLSLLLLPLRSTGHPWCALFPFSFLSESVRGRYLHKHKINADRHPCVE